MKVLHLINDLNAGGAERLLIDSLPVFNRNYNVQVDLLLLSGKKNIFENELREAGINVFICKNKNVKNIAHVLYIKQFILKGQYDIVHVHLFPSNYWVSLASKLITKKRFVLIASEHNTFNRRRNYKVFQLIDKFIYKEFDFIISIGSKTEYNLQKWLKVNGNEKQKFVIVENAVNINRFMKAEPFEKKELILTHTNNVKLICMIGSFGKQKDQKTLIKSMVFLHENIHLLLVGQGERLKELKDLVTQLDLTKRVHFLGVRTDVERIIKTSDIIALSSNWEGFGLVAVEGMAAGKPIIASNVDGLREVVEDAGLLFEKGNSKEFSELAQKLLEDEKFYKEISNKCTEKSKKYDLQAMVNRTYHIYNSALANYEIS